MQSHRSFHLLGDKQLDRVSSRLEAAHSSWLSHWFTLRGGRDIQIRCDLPSTATDEVSGVWLAVILPQGSAYVGVSDKQCAQILDSWIGGSPDSSWRDGYSAGTKLVGAILADWFCRFATGRGESFESAPTDLRTERASLPEHLFYPYSGVVRIQVNAWFGDFVAFLDWGVVEGSVLDTKPDTLSSAGPWGSRHQAVQTADIKLRASASASSRLTVGTLHALEVGDVVMLESTVDDPWVLTTESGERVAHCHIGRRGQNFAISLTSRDEESR